LEEIRVVEEIDDLGTIIEYPSVHEIIWYGRSKHDFNIKTIIKRCIYRGYVFQNVCSNILVAGYRFNIKIFERIK
jgi:hypothetical protein